MVPFWKSGCILRLQEIEKLQTDNVVLNEGGSLLTTNFQLTQFWLHFFVFLDVQLDEEVYFNARWRQRKVMEFRNLC